MQDPHCVDATNRRRARAKRSPSIWLIDSGSEQDLISDSMLSQVGAYNRRSADHPISFITANGSTESNAVAEIDLNTLPGSITPYILEQTPSVLSVGTRCMDQGYSFVWPAGSAPFLVRPDGKAVVLKVDGHVPILDDSCPVVSTRSFKPAKVRKLLALPGVSKPIRDEEVVAVRSRKSADLIVEAQSSKHHFLHFPKNPFCRTCQRARVLAPYARSKGGQARVDTTRFGDHVIADHVLIKANVEEGMKGEKVALVIKDIHTQFRYVYPSQSRFAEDCTFAINHFVNGKDDVEVIYTDSSRELKAAIKELGYRHQTSIECVDSSKSFVEREIRQMLEGARSNLVQAGMPLRTWPMAMQHFAIAVNANPQLSGGDI